MNEVHEMKLLLLAASHPVAFKKTAFETFSEAESHL